MCSCNINSCASCATRRCCCCCCHFFVVLYVWGSLTCVKIRRVLSVTSPWALTAEWHARACIHKYIYCSGLSLECSFFRVYNVYKRCAWESKIFVQFVLSPFCSLGWRKERDACSKQLILLFLVRDGVDGMVAKARAACLPSSFTECSYLKQKLELW